MIVVDTNVIASLVLPGPRAAKAERAFRADRDWVAPLLWRSELLNLLVGGLRGGRFDLAAGAAALRAADLVVDGREFVVPGHAVLRTALDSGLTAYDSEFVVLARELHVPLVTLDQGILKAVPDVAVSLDDFG